MSSSSSNFQSMFNTALEAYEKATKNKLLTHPLAAQLQSCDSPSAILSVLKNLVQQSDQRSSSDERSRKWLDPTVNVLYTFSATLGGGVGMAFPAANVIFTGIGVLLSAAKDVNASQGVLVDLFARIDNFIMRLESYKDVSPTHAMTDLIVRIMIEVIFILSIATAEINQRRRRRYLNRLLGKSDIEDALKRLDTLTQEEARMAVAEVLKVTHMMDDKIRLLIDAITQQTTMNQVGEEKLKQLKLDLRRWLSAPDFSTNHNIARNVHHEGTATWFFQGEIFNEWKITPSLLWIYGKPGSGKSIMCSSIIEDIMGLRESRSASLAYFYFDFRDEDKRSRRSLLLSFLSQLSAQSNLCCGVLSRLYSAHDDGARKPGDSALKQCLKEMLSLPAQGPIYLIVDALDECPNNSGLPTAREEVLEFVVHLADLRLPNLYLCATSRPEIDIQTAFEPLTSLRVSLHNQTGQKKDIVDYVSSVVYSDMKMRRWREEDKKLVIEALSERADGMFRWVFCQLEALRHCLPSSVQRILGELPETLDETYEQVLMDINKANREPARRLLQCLTVALRPLRVEELAEVLAIDFDTPAHGGIPQLNPTWRWEDQHQAVLSTCSSLIAIVDDGDYRVVQFSHFSVKEFLTSNRLARSNGGVSRYHIILEPAHTILAQACLGILFRLGDRVDDDNLEDIPLVEYAARHWFDHARFENVASRIQDAMKYFFDADKPHWTPWSRVQRIDVSLTFFSSNERGGAFPLYYASLGGFYDLAEHLIGKNPEHVNAKGGQMLTPLVAALSGDHFQVAELLHRHGADVDVRGRLERTLLYEACRTGSLDTLQWLLDHGADVNAHDSKLWVPLHCAADCGQLQAFKTIIEHGVDIHVRDKFGISPLHMAASPCQSVKHDQIDIMQVLLDHGANPNALDNDDSTPLHHSSWWGKEGHKHGQGTVEGVRLLLKHGAIIDAEDNEGRTPLQLALEHERDDIVACLEEHGASGEMNLRTDI